MLLFLILGAALAYKVGGDDVQLVQLAERVLKTTPVVDLLEVSDSLLKQSFGFLHELLLILREVRLAAD